MRVIVSNIRRVHSSDGHAHYDADVIVDGVQKSFSFRLGFPTKYSVTADRSFHDLFYPTYAAKEIGLLLGRVHEGERIIFPVDLGEFS